MQSCKTEFKCLRGRSDFRWKLLSAQFENQWILWYSTSVNATKIDVQLCHQTFRQWIILKSESVVGPVIIQANWKYDQVHKVLASCRRHKYCSKLKDIVKFRTFCQYKMWSSLSTFFLKMIAIYRKCTQMDVNEVQRNCVLQKMICPFALKVQGKILPQFFGYQVLNQKSKSLLLDVKNYWLKF